jgi:hypothetical protein
MQSYNDNKRKSRDLGFNKYFITLQLEYIVAELRKKIYPDLSGKNKSKEIMAGKMKKIKDIAMRNSLKTIFPDFNLGEVSMYDEDLRIKLYREIYGGHYPNFIYRDDDQKRKLGYKDKKCYYMLGTEFQIIDTNKTGTLQVVDIENNVCYMRVGDEAIKYKLSEIKRIL